MSSRAEIWNDFLEHLQSAQATLPSDVRRAIYTAARDDDPGSAPADLAGFVGTVAEHAYRVTDEQVDALRAGRSEDEIFECLVLAAAGAADRRMRAALRAMGASS